MRFLAARRYAWGLACPEAEAQGDGLRGWMPPFLPRFLPWYFACLSPLVFTCAHATLVFTGEWGLGSDCCTTALGTTDMTAHASHHITSRLDVYLFFSSSLPAVLLRLVVLLHLVYSLFFRDSWGWFRVWRFFSLLGGAGNRCTFSGWMDGLISHSVCCGGWRRRTGRVLVWRRGEGIWLSF